MFGYCPGCDDVLADIGPGEGVCQDCYIAEVRAESQEERLLAKIEARGDNPLRAISVKRAHRISPVELRIRPPQSWMYCKKAVSPD